MSMEVCKPLNKKVGWPLLSGQRAIYLIINPTCMAKKRQLSNLLADTIS